MFKTTIKFDNFKEIKQWTPKMLKALDKGLDDTADEVAKIADNNIRDKDNGSFDTGLMAESQVVDKILKFHKEVAYLAPYSPFIEFGTRPHWPPVMRLYEWALRQRDKLGISTGKLIKTKKDGYVYENIWKIAWNISRKISEEGSDPKPFFRPAIEEGRDKMNEFVKKRIEAIK